MMKSELVGAAALALLTTLAAPATAQGVIQEPGYCAQFYPDANCQNKGPGNPYTGDYQRRPAYRSYGAIATVPFRGDSYAYDDGERGWYGQSYGERNGFVCQSGAWFRAEDGRRHPCR